MGGTLGSGGAVHASSSVAVAGGNTNGDTSLLITTITASTKKFTFASTGANKVMPTAAGPGPGFVVGDRVVVATVAADCSGSKAATDNTGCCAAAGTYTVASVDLGGGTGFITVQETVIADANADVQCKISRPAVKAGEAGSSVALTV